MASLAEYPIFQKEEPTQGFLLRELPLTVEMQKEMFSPSRKAESLKDVDNDNHCGIFLRRGGAAFSLHPDTLWSRLNVWFKCLAPTSSLHTVIKLG